MTTGPRASSRFRPDVERLLDHMAQLDRPPLEGLDPAELQRVIQATLIAGADRRSFEPARVEDLAIAGSGGTRLGLRLYSAHRPDAVARPVVLFFHGGGFMTGNLDTHDALACDIAMLLQTTLVSVDYRLAPQHPFPAAVDDAEAALDWLSGGPPEIGHPVDGVIVAGDSAGGNLAAHCGLRAGRSAQPVVCQWLMYASVDMAAAGGSMDEYAAGYILTASMLDVFRSAYLPVPGDRLQPDASPLRDEIPDGVAPAMVFTCELDPLRDQAREYAARLVAAGASVRYREGKGLTHGAFTQRRIVSSAMDDLRGCVEDVRSLVAERGARL